MTRERGELPEPEEQLLGIERPTEEQETESQRKTETERELRRLFIQRQMENPMFREWLHGWLLHWNTFENAFGASPTGFPDPNATWFKAGMKAAGWDLWDSIDAQAPELAALMRREAKKAQG